MQFQSAVQALCDAAVDFIVIGGVAASPICVVTRTVPCPAEGFSRRSDLLAEVTGLGGYHVVKFRSVSIQAFQHEFAILDLSALVLAKRSAGREKALPS
jgi:hypothetical protein